MNVNKFQNNKDSEYIDVESMVNFIKCIYNNNGHDPIDLVFYGGEPLLYQDAILDFVEKSRELQIRQSLHTNGTLLDKTYPEILHNLDTIILSIDGPERITDKNRGKNVYSKIRNNIENIRREYDGEIIARATLTLDASVKDAVLDLIRWLDGIYWQIENSPKFDSKTINEFLEKYPNEIRDLVDLWIDEAKNSNIINILPFQAIASTFLMKRHEKTLRCGCGSRLIVTDGVKCFACDELAETANEVYLGMIKENVNPNIPLISQRVNETCACCSIRYICGGRCYNSLAYFPREKFEFYCNTTHILVQSVQKIIPDLKSVVDSKLLAVEQLSHPALGLVDQIP